MGQTIWKTMERYRGLWIAVDGKGSVLGSAGELAELKTRVPLARHFMFVAGEERANPFSV